MPHGLTADSYQLESVKVCGITSTADRDLVADAGADIFGALIDVAYSPRSLTLDKAKPLFDSTPIPGIVLLFNPGIDLVLRVVEQLDPFAVQLLGSEQPEQIAALKGRLECEVWKSLYVPARGHGEIDLAAMEMLAQDYEDSGADVLVMGTLDASGGGARLGGSGIVGDWALIRNLVKERMVPHYLAGGLTPENAVSALQAVRPTGIDVCSGVESSPGKKDPAKLAGLFEVLAPYRMEQPE